MSDDFIIRNTDVPGTFIYPEALFDRLGLSFGETLNWISNDVTDQTNVAALPAQSWLIQRITNTADPHIPTRHRERMTNGKRLGNLRDKYAAMRLMWDWAIFNGRFGVRRTKTAITDIDGALERNGHLLFLEGKSLHNAGLSIGQKRLFDALIGMATPTQSVTVLSFAGFPPRDVRTLTVLSSEAHFRMLRHQTSTSDLIQLVSDWFEWAST